MVMAVKHQVLMSRNPRHLVMVTLNHLDAIRDFVAMRSGQEQVVANIQLAYELLLQVHCVLLLNVRTISTRNFRVFALSFEGFFLEF